MKKSKASKSFFLKAAKKLFRLGLYFGFTILAVMVLFELAYRYYVIDFYKSELNGLNNETLLKSKTDKATILLLGDSFTADPNGYVQVLRDSLENVQVINSGVPGTGIIQTSLFAKKRIKQFKPDVLVYQIYVGNDLMDIHHPWNGQSISILRNLYWWFSDGFRSLSFINFRSAGIRYRYFDDTGTGLSPRSDLAFSPEKYNGRQKLFFDAEPGLVENSVFVTGRRSKDASTLIRKLGRILHHTDSSGRVLLLVIPHCMQVNNFYKQNMLSIGAKLSPGLDILQPDYPFLNLLKETFDSEKISVVNVLPALQQFDKTGNRLFYENDPHLNAKGHEVVGRKMLEALDSKILN